MKTALLSCLLLVTLPAFAADPTPIEKSVASPERTAADRERDKRDKPAEVMAFAGVRPGMVVADIFAAGGYYSELLAGVVGPQGKVLAVNNVPYATYSKDNIKERFTEGRLKNVERRLVEASYMNIAPKSVDLVVIIMAPPMTRTSWRCGAVTVSVCRSARPDRQSTVSPPRAGPR